ncbi:uncharacterized protein FA14DRAFT_159302 [Meira miltonrushii]|uniref:Pali-domain-containing protein n=1 Tax=Meira miltonrushii TaxID=1280837 RepID=A0A316VHH2_9BASI|nr:uncharacterized protein FA14DRAFT_159302 [Meira miltonrushii]PWN37107.1 hypothetical protein FA14DRAFT_159302 [Meira miltonrushii]
MGYARRVKGSLRQRCQAFCNWLGPTKCVLLGAFILFGSFIIQLLTSIGVPYIKAFDFYRFDLSNYTFVELGMWAACNGREAFLIPTRPDLNQGEEFNCPPAAWGWQTLRYSGITRAFFDNNLPKALIMHPIACCFTFFAMVTALVTMKRQKQHFLLPIFSFFSCLFALVSFVIDLATFVPARHKLLSPDAYNILGALVISTNYGPAFWLSLTCFVLDIFGNSIIIAGYGIWRMQRNRSRCNSQYEKDADIEMRGGSRMARRGYFANDSVASLRDHLPYDERKITEGERGSGTLSAMSKHSVASRSQSATPTQTLQEVTPAAHHEVIPASHHEEEEHIQARDEEEEDMNSSDEDDDGYDSAVSAYADARSEVDGASRSRVTLSSPTIESTRRSSDGVSRAIKRKPVQGY